MPVRGQRSAVTTWAARSSSWVGNQMSLLGTALARAMSSASNRTLCPVPTKRLVDGLDMPHCRRLRRSTYQS